MGNSVLSHPMSWVCRFCVIFFVITHHVIQAEEAEKVIVEPEAAPGCPIPDLRYSRPRKLDGAISTELPNISSDVSQTSSKEASSDTPDASNTNGFIAELTVEREVGRHSRYINFDPYAWNDGKKLDRNAQSHTEHTIHRRKARSQQRQSKTPSSSINTIDSLSSLNISEILNQTNNREINAITNSFEIGIKLSPNGHNQEIDTGSTLAQNAPINDTSSRRVKRKSGKTTGALSRPKGASDSGSKSTSRKKDGASLDEEGQYIVHATDDGEGDSTEDEEDEDAVEHDLFGEVTEVHFPAEVGNVGERKLCRIRCVQGKWVGPICATKEEGV